MRWLVLVVIITIVTPAAAAPPNVVVVMTDDMGFSDLGCYGGEIATPNLDKLAAGGVRFTQFYNTARCCPTRASLLTGLYPHQAGIGHMMEDRGEQFPGYRGNLNTQCVTIAEALRPAGYRNYAVGKWHVMPQSDVTAAGPFDHWPTQRGFDRWYGFHGALADQWHPELFEDNGTVEAPTRPNYHLSEDLVDRAGLGAGGAPKRARLGARDRRARQAGPGRRPHERRMSSSSDRPERRRATEWS